ncbi:MAG: UbiD family decarboxylase, partial [Methanobacteriota archaeon]
MRTYIDLMRKHGLVVDIHEPVSSVYEAPKRSFGTDKLLFFHNLDGKRAVMNLTASREALSLALGVQADKLVPQLASCRYDGVVREEGTITCSPPDLDQIPIMKHYPLDAGRYVCAGVVFSRYNGVENASVHRMLKQGKDKLVARLVEGRHTHTMLKQALLDGTELPIAIAIGLHPLVMFASCSRVPAGMELPFAAELLGGEILVKTLSNGVRVPDAE